MFLAAEIKEPSISLVGNEHVLIMGKDQEAAIKAYNPAFQIRKQTDYIPSLVKGYRFSSRQALFAVVCDLNGDGKEDLVIDGHDDANNLLIAVVSSKSGPYVLEINKWQPLATPKDDYYGMGDHVEYGLSDYLEFVPKGEINSPHEEHPLKLSTDAFELGIYEKGSAVFYLKDGKFQSYATSD